MGNGRVKDASNGWEEIANEFMSLRSDIGVETVSKWADSFPAQATVLDLGCGFGEPNSTLLFDRGFRVHGIDASPTLVAEFKRRLPLAPVSCEAVEESAFFAKKFEGVLAIGLVFILDQATQLQVIRRIADTLTPNGSFLFSAPSEICQWGDTLTGRTSLSLGKEEYVSVADSVGLSLAGTHTDAGGNFYYEMRKA